MTEIRWWLKSEIRCGVIADFLTNMSGCWAVSTVNQTTAHGLCNLAFTGQGIGSKDKRSKREPEGSLISHVLSFILLFGRKSLRPPTFQGRKNDAPHLERRNVNEFEDTLKNLHPAA